MRSVYVVTHAESLHHLDGLVGGWHDSDLSAHGHEQAARIARAVSALVPQGEPRSVYTSDLHRATQTAAPVAEALGVAPTPVAGLREISYGEAEGRPQSWLDERFEPAGEDATARLDHAFGIPGAETRRQFALRVFAAMDSILTEEIASQVIVTHGHALTFVISAWLRLPVEAVAWVHFRGASGGITHLHEDARYRNRSVVSLNDTAHLAMP